MTITDTALATGITNPFTLTNPSWRIYSRGLGLAGGTTLATFENGDSAAAVL